MSLRERLGNRPLTAGVTAMPTDPKHIGSLRRKSEKLLSDAPKEPALTSLMDAQRLIHELSVHQIELEVQNEDLRNTRDQLEQLRREYVDLYDFAPVGYFTFDKTGLITRANLTACGLLGIERSLLAKKPFSLFIHPDCQNEFYFHLRSVRESTTAKTCQLGCKRKDGTFFDAQLESIAVQLDGNGTIRTILTDITDRKQFEKEPETAHQELENRVEERTAELRAEIAEHKRTEEEREHLASFPRRNPNPIIEVDASGEIIFFNPASQAVLESLGMDKGDLKALLPPDLDVILRDLDKKGELNLYREVQIADRIFDETVQLVPQSNTVRVYGRDITDRNRAEVALERARVEAELRAADLQAVLDVAPLAIWIAHDPQCLQITGNRYTDGIMQVSHGANISASALPDDAAVTYRVFRDGIEMKPEELPAQVAASTGKPVAATMMDLVFSDGRDVRMVLSVVPLFDAQGRVRGSVTAGADVTQLTKAKEALRVSLAQYNLLAESITDIFAALDRNLRHTYWNRAAEEVTGISAEEILGKTWLEVFPNNDATKKDDEYCRQCMKTGQPMQYENNYVFRGREHAFEVRFFSTGDGISIFRRDITERKMAEQGLKESEARFRAAFDGSAVPMSITAPDGKMIKVNGAFCEMMGYSEAELCLHSPSTSLLIRTI
jgi:PAS domain S-box-containing protein